LREASTMRKDSRVEIFIMDKKCTFCDNQTRVCFIVKGFSIKLCWECAGILKGLIKDKEAEVSDEINKKLFDPAETMEDNLKRKSKPLGKKILEEMEKESSQSNIVKAERKFHFYCVRCNKRTEHVKVALDYICTLCENQESIELSEV